MELERQLEKQREMEREREEQRRKMMEQREVEYWNISFILSVSSPFSVESF